MQLLPIQTPVIKEGDNLVEIIAESGSFQNGDIIAISAKVVATAEGAHIDLRTIEVSDEAAQWTEKLNRIHPDPAFRQAVLDEAKRLNGRVIGTCPQAMLAEIKPEGLQNGSILAVNAGLDRSNVEKNYAIGWPHDPIESTSKLKRELEKATGKTLAVILTDSCCRPRRLGVSAMALTVSGMNAFNSEVGKQDLFENDLTITREATADQLATAANFVMGNANQSTPAVIIRDHGLEFSEYEGWVVGIDPEEDLFKGML